MTFKDSIDLDKLARDHREAEELYDRACELYVNAANIDPNVSDETLDALYADVTRAEHVRNRVRRIMTEVQDQTTTSLIRDKFESGLEYVVDVALGLAAMGIVSYLFALMWAMWMVW